MPPVGERVTASMPQHVRVRLKAELGLDPCPLHHAGKSGRGERRSSLRGKHKGRFWLLLALQPSERSQFITEDGMGAWSARLDSADVQGRGFELDLVP